MLGCTGTKLIQKLNFILMLIYFWILKYIKPIDAVLQNDKSWDLTSPIEK